MGPLKQAPLESEIIMPVAFVSIIIPTYRDWDRLKACVYVLENQSYPKDLYEIIILNNDPYNYLSTMQLPSNCVVLLEPKRGTRLGNRMEP